MEHIVMDRKILLLFRLIAIHDESNRGFGSAHQTSISLFHVFDFADENVLDQHDWNIFIAGIIRGF